MKRCSLCDVVKPVAEFHRNRGTRDGRDSRCKVCVRIAVAVSRGNRNPNTGGRVTVPDSWLPRCLHCDRVIEPCPGSRYGSGMMHSDDRRELGDDGHLAEMAYAELPGVGGAR